MVPYVDGFNKFVWMLIQVHDDRPLEVINLVNQGISACAICTKAGLGSLLGLVIEAYTVVGRRCFSSLQHFVQHLDHAEIVSLCHCGLSDANHARAIPRLVKH